MADQNNLNQAKHNEALAKQLLREGVYFDWALTIAYYACNHYVKHHLFPLDDHGIPSLKGPCETFDDYFDMSEKGETMHHALCKLFIEKVPGSKVPLSFRKLCDACHTARYYDYDTDPSKAKAAISTLDSIAKMCSVKRSGGSKRRPRLKKRR